MKTRADKKALNARRMKRSGTFVVLVMEERYHDDDEAEVKDVVGPFPTAADARRWIKTAYPPDGPYRRIDVRQIGTPIG